MPHSLWNARTIAALTALVTVAFALSACASSQPIRYVGAGGQYGSGSIAMNGTLHDGEFTAIDGKSTCTGHFTSWSNLTISFPVTCTNGARGTVTLTRPMDGPLTATGVMQLSNGEARQVVYGQAAK